MHHGKTVDESATAHAIVIPMEAQGAAFDAEGKLWIATSGGQHGTLHRVDPGTAAVLARFETAPGIEGIEFGADGKLWATSENGSRKYLGRGPEYPLIFEIDVAKLR